MNALIQKNLIDFHLFNKSDDQFQITKKILLFKILNGSKHLRRFGMGLFCIYEYEHFSTDYLKAKFSFQ